VILEHTGSADYKPGVHWDLMLEAGDGLRTWELDRRPREGSTVRATELGVHRLDYLDYEGPVSGNRGSVRRWDSGQFDVLSEAPNVIEISIHGGKLAGRMMLCRDREDEPKWSVELAVDDGLTSCGRE
jgi:hypothetical protein